MRHYPEDGYDHKEVKELNVEEWQVETLKLNPSYVFWGPHEDYMTSGGGWEENLFFKTWEAYEIKNLDDLNECVNFYFHLRRESENCVHCDNSGLNPESYKISETFYDFDKTGQRWCNDITEDEVAALAKAGRLYDFIGNTHFSEEDNCWYTWNNRKKSVCDKPKFPTPEEVNTWNKTDIGHDAINRHILVKTRSKRLGVWGECEHCEGKGFIYTEEKGKLGLTLWILHPRKGCSRGVEIEKIKREELPEVFAFLRTAADRNEERFMKIPKG